MINCAVHFLTQIPLVFMMMVTHNLVNSPGNALHLFDRAKYCILLGICLSLSLPLVGQEPVTLAEASQEAFIQAKQEEVRLRMDSPIKKVDHVIRIESQLGDAIVFRDDLSEETYQTYAYAGDLVSGKIILIHVQDFHTDRYIAVDLSSGEQHVLIGFPHRLANTIACLQGAETDEIPAIEIWNIRNDKLSLMKRFKLPEQRYPVDLVWKDENEILLNDTAGKFWVFRTDVN